MFRTKHVAVALAGARLNRAKASDDDDEEITIVETNLVIEPWPPDLLRELGEAAYQHVFLADRRLRPELRQVRIRPVGGAAQVFAFAPAVDVDPDATIEPVLVRHITFHRKENEKKGAEWVRGIIRCEMEYRDKDVRELLAKRFGQRVFLTAMPLNGRLDFEPPPAPTTVTVTVAPGAGDAPTPDPEAGDVLDEQRAAGARTTLHTGRDKRRRGGGNSDGGETLH